MTEQNKKILKDLSIEQLKKLCKKLNIMTSGEDTKMCIMKKILSNEILLPYNFQEILKGVVNK